MEFVIPTTKSEMFNELDKIFKHYRIDRYGYQKVELLPVTFNRLPLIEKTEEEFLQMAKTELAGTHLREIKKLKQTASNEIIKLNSQLLTIDQDLNETIEKVDQLFLESVEKVKKQVVLNGLVSSDYLPNKIAQLESDKNAEIISLTEKSVNKKSLLLAEIEKNQSEIDNAEEYFFEIHNAEILAKKEEIKDKIAEKNREIETHNAGVQEKDDKYKNSLIRQQTELELQFMQIRNGEFTESELIDMGYYKDVVDCVRAYYDTLDLETAYNDMIKEQRLVVYLGDYYAHLCFSYRQQYLDYLEFQAN